MSIVTRAGKGLPLTHSELDNNFEELNSRILNNTNPLLLRKNFGTFNLTSESPEIVLFKIALPDFNVYQYDLFVFAVKSFSKFTNMGSVHPKGMSSDTGFSIFDVSHNGTSWTIDNSQIVTSLNFNIVGDFIEFSFYPMPFDASYDFHIEICCPEDLITYIDNSQYLA